MEMCGPDYIFPTEQLTTSDSNGYTKLNLMNNLYSFIPSKSLVTAVKEACEEGGSDLIAFKQKKDGIWKYWSYHDYYRDITCITRAFIKLGLEERHSVCISGFNGPEWFLSSMGSIFGGGMAVGLYPTMNADTILFILEDCKANLLIVEDEKTLKALYPYWSQLPNLKKIIKWGDPILETVTYSENVLHWADVMHLGMEDENDLAMLERHKNMAINQCCSLIYTSGTTGNPKGVMLSHDNLYYTAMAAIQQLHLRKREEVFVSYLPLSHIAGNIIDIWAAVLNLHTIVFADKMMLKDGKVLGETLRDARPTIFFGVPRIWEKIMEGMQNKGRDTKGLKKKLVGACKSAGVDYNLNSKTTLMYNVGQKFIYPKVLNALGLDRCRIFVSGAAPITPETLRYFLGFNIIIHEAYGMSETTGCHCMMSGNEPKPGWVGRSIAASETKMLDPDAQGNGEICMRGRNIMMGYINREDKTREDIDSEGWLHSGDVGFIDYHGNIRISGRIKELIITAGGENIAPVPIENAIKEELPCLSNVILLGDKRKFLSCFLTFRVNEDGMKNPTDYLDSFAIDWSKSIGSTSTKVSEILSGPDDKILNAIQDGINKANEKAISRAARVQKWTILPRDISESTGEIGPTMKLKRFFINQKYHYAIGRFYA